MTRRLVFPNPQVEQTGTFTIGPITDWGATPTLPEVELLLKEVCGLDDKRFHDCLLDGEIKIIDITGRIQLRWKSEAEKGAKIDIPYKIAIPNFDARLHGEPLARAIWEAVFKHDLRKWLIRQLVTEAWEEHQAEAPCP